MKIAIDARLYGLEHAGPGRYVLNLVNHLAKIDKVNTYEILLRKQYFDTLELPNNWRKHLVDVRHYSFKEQYSVASLLNKINPQITHFPHFNVPVFYTKPYVVTLHDLSIHRSKGPESTTLPFYLYAIKRLGYEKVFSAAVTKSKTIIVPSMFVKNDLLKSYTLHEDKVQVTYEGVSIQKQDVDVFKKYKLLKPYFVFVGSAYPHKNLDRLVEAIVHLNEQKGVNAMLAISCARSIFAQRLESIVKQKKAEQYVNLLGFVPDEDLSSLYKESVALVYPTLMEGFGLPGLEAMEAKTVVLTSDIPVLKEIYGKHATYFNPFDFTAISSAMKQTLELTRIERAEKIRTAHSFVKKYSWKKMAEQTLDIYQHAINES